MWGDGRMFEPEGTTVMYRGVEALSNQQLGELRKLPFLESKVREVGRWGGAAR